MSCCFFAAAARLQRTVVAARAKRAASASKERHVQRTRTGSARIVLAAGVMAIAAGCAAVQQSFTKMPGMGELDTRPGLADVRPLGARGQKCYDFCATSEASCKHMCPTSEVGECRDDCVTDTKNCLEECPDLWRPAPPPPNG
jgi:hypothetical protein